MSIVEYHDILAEQSKAMDRARSAQVTQSGEDVTLLTPEARESMCSDLRAVKKGSKRADYMLSLDHCFYQNTTFVQEYELKFTPSTDSDTGVNSNYCTVPLIFDETTGYEKMCSSWDAFMVNKITATFYSTEGTNITPIVCKYLMPPFNEKTPVSFIDKATKQAECKSTEKGFMTVNDPFCLVVNDKVYNPLLQRGMMSMNIPNVHFDFGTFGLYARNTEQKGTIIVEWNVDLYSSVIYNSVADAEDAKFELKNGKPKKEEPVVCSKPKRAVKIANK